jgi:hypothetical protein
MHLLQLQQTPVLQQRSGVWPGTRSHQNQRCTVEYTISAQKSVTVHHVSVAEKQHVAISACYEQPRLRRMRAKPLLLQLQQTTPMLQSTNAPCRGL